MMLARLLQSLRPSWCSDPRRLSDAASTCAPMLATAAIRLCASLKNMATSLTSKGAARKPEEKRRHPDEASQAVGCGGRA